MQTTFDTTYLVGMDMSPNQMQVTPSRPQTMQSKVKESTTTEEVVCKSDMPGLDTTSTPPCCHNRWALHIRKKRYYVFECMTCLTLWKTKLTGSQKCLDFFAGHCPNGDACEYPHIYSKRVCNREESSLEVFRSSGVGIGGFSNASHPTDLQYLLNKVQQLAEEEELSESSYSNGDSISLSSSCNSSE